MKSMKENFNLYAEERKNKIIALLEEAGRIEVPDLVELFKVSGTTIRNDLRELEKEERLTRTHGGAIKIQKRSFEDRPGIRMATEEKKQIAKKAVSFIEDGDSIAIDTGTSCLAFAQALIQSELLNIKVITNDLTVAALLEDQTDYTVFFTGGVIRNGFHYTSGEHVVSSLKGFLVDKVILGTTSFSIKNGFSTPNFGISEIKRSLIAIGKKRIVLCEAAKIGKDSLNIFASINDIELLITDSQLSKPLEKSLEHSPISFVVA
ncbi:DeoR/GlpR family DNA-binding transcription regulator [Vagococcus allomyrinae]|nr:DeoR/GlpR family DNA-binding transcription regulator [Vagococcus allomyrinae]